MDPETTLMLWTWIHGYFGLNLALTVLSSMGIAIYRHFDKNQGDFFFWITYVSIAFTFGLVLIAVFLAIMIKEWVMFKIDEIGSIPPEYWPPPGIP